MRDEDYARILASVDQFAEEQKLLAPVLARLHAELVRSGVDPYHATTLAGTYLAVLMATIRGHRGHKGDAS